MIDHNPCKGCTERHLACHDSCEKYKEWRDQYQAQEKSLKAHRSRWYTPRSDARDKRDDYHIKHPTKGRKGGEQ
jgi:Fe-S-cluster-containing dehydrogenase component